MTAPFVPPPGAPPGLTPRHGPWDQSAGAWTPPGMPGGFSLTLPGGGTLQGSEVEWAPSFRVIARQYAGPNLFDRLAPGRGGLLAAVAGATSADSLAAVGALAGVLPEDRRTGPGTSLVMAAFAWPGGRSRFSAPARGTYYAAAEVETAIRETMYHDAQELAKGPSGPTVLEKAVVVADLRARGRAALPDIRAPRPTPADVYHDTDYGPGQTFGGYLRNLHAHGVLYDSVRHAGGTCVAVFRPPVLSDARAVATLQYAWDGAELRLR